MYEMEYLTSYSYVLPVCSIDSQPGGGVAGGTRAAVVLITILVDRTPVPVRSPPGPRSTSLARNVDVQTTSGRSLLGAPRKGLYRMG